MMEIIIIFIVTEAFCFPYKIYRSLLDPKYRGEGPNNFADAAVGRIQRNIQGNRNLWLYWPGDPPFDYFEVSGYTQEAEARRLEGIAVMLEGFGNWAGAAGKWEEAEEAWEKTIEAWQAVPRHPEREKRVSAARARLHEVRAKKVEAQWKGASWDVSSFSDGQVTIRYSSWPARFKAKIADTKGNVLTSFDKPSGTGVVTWGKGAETGVYFIKVEAERVEPRVRKIVIL